MTKIEWTEKTWNPIVGCSVVSHGCTNCYAMKMAARIERMGNAPQYDGTTQQTRGGPVFTGKVALAEKALFQPLKRKKPTMYFVNSMGDLFHENVPDEWIDRVFSVIARTPQHTYQILTKRAARMRKYIAGCKRGADDIGGVWPLPNVWLGVSAEDQKRADERIPHLLGTPAAIRFVSAEPLLGPINFGAVPFLDDGGDPRNKRHALDGSGVVWAKGENEPVEYAVRIYCGMDSLDWIIVGGESGHGARPMHPYWALSIRDQCAAADVAFFFKQWGEWGKNTGFKPSGTPGNYAIAGPGLSPPTVITFFPRQMDLMGSRLIERVGKKLAGRTLEGATHDGMPT